MRFLGRVGVRRLDGCEPWLGQVSARSGGGLFFDDDNRQRSAQVVRWELAHGALPPRASVTQRCSQPTCVRLEHLRLGRTVRRRGVPATGLSQTPGAAGALPVHGAWAPAVLGDARRARRHAELLLQRTEQILLRSRDVVDVAARAAPVRTRPSAARGTEVC